MQFYKLIISVQFFLIIRTFFLLIRTFDCNYLIYNLWSRTDFVICFCRFIYNLFFVYANTLSVVCRFAVYHIPSDAAGATCHSLFVNTQCYNFSLSPALLLCICACRNRIILFLSTNYYVSWIWIRCISNLFIHKNARCNIV